MLISICGRYSVFGAHKCWGSDVWGEWVSGLEGVRV